MNKKVAVVAGSTGLVGRELVRQLCESPDHKAVIALARDQAGDCFKTTDDKLIVRGLPSGDDVIVGDEFYCAIGTTIKKAGSRDAFIAVDQELVLDLARRAKAGGVSRVVVVTSVGSDPDSKNFYLRVKGQTERGLKAMSLKSLEIYRPSLLLGGRDEPRFLERLGVLSAPVLSWLMFGTLSKYRPIQAAELARKMIHSVPVAG